MKLTEALATNRRIRNGSVGSYFRVGNDRGFTLAEVQSEAWEVEPDVELEISFAQLKDAWNSSRPSSGSVGTADESPMFIRFAQSLGFY